MGEKTERDYQREAVEQVFRLTGGELEDKPWECEVADAGHRGYHHIGGYSWAYWYEGAPDYVERCQVMAWEWDPPSQVRTVVGEFIYSHIPEWLVDDQGAWIRVEVFTSSGETECPYRGGEEGDTVTKEQADEEYEWCPYCEMEVGEEHGYVYIGEGWAEVVYVLAPECEEENEESEEE